MNHEFKIVISAPAELAGAAAPGSAFENLEPQAGPITAAATVLTGAMDRLTQAAARTPDASLASLAAATRQAQANAGAASQPMAGLANAPDDLLAKLPTGFGVDFHAEIIDGVEGIGHVFTEALQRGLEPSAGRPPAAVAPDASPAADRSGGSSEAAARLKDGDGEIIGRPPAASRAGLGDQPTDATLDAASRAVTAVPAPANDPAASAAKQALAERLDRAAQLQEDYRRAVQQEGTPAAGDAGSLPARQNASADARERRHGARQEISDAPSAGDNQAGAPPVERRVQARPAAAKHPDAGRAARHAGRPQEHARQRGERGTFAIDGHHGDGDPGGGLHTGGLTTGSPGGVGTSTAAGVLAGAPGAADLLAGRSLYPASPATGPTRGAGLAADGVGSFSTAPTAAAGLGPALAGIGAAQSTAAAPGTPAGGQSGVAGPAVDKVEAAAGRGFEEATRAVDRLHATLSKGFQTLNERLERVEQTTREHTAQISNRA